MSTSVVRVNGDYKIETQGGNITLDADGTGIITLNGNLNIVGTTTSITTTDTDITDNVIVLNNGESISHAGITLGTSGIKINRGSKSWAQILFDETLYWTDPSIISNQQTQGVFVFSTVDGNLNGIRTNSIDTGGANLNLIGSSLGSVTVRGTTDYERQILDYNKLTQIFTISSIARSSSNIVTIVTNEVHGFDITGSKTVYVYITCLTNATFNAIKVRVLSTTSTSFTYANTGSVVTTTTAVGIVRPNVIKDDDGIPNMLAVADYADNLKIINKLAITAPTNGATITIADAKTLTVNNSVIFTSTDTSSTPTVSLGTGGTVTYRTDNLSVFSSTTSAQLAGIISDETGYTTGSVLVFSTSPQITTSLTTNSASFDLVNTTATTGNLFGAATVVTIGATTGTLNLRNATITAANATTFNMNGASPSITTSSTATASVFNTNALTGNLFGAATTIAIGSSSAATLTLNPGTVVGANTTQNLYNTVATTMNFAGAATLSTIGYSSTDTSTTNISTGGVGNGKTKTINIGTGAQSGSTTSINIGSSNGSTTTINGHITVEGVTSTGATGTGNLVFSASPSLTGTVTIATLNLTNALGIAYGGTNSTSFITPASNINPIVYYNGTSLTNNSLAADIGYNSTTDNFFTRNITTVSLSAQSTSGGSLVQIQTDPGAAMISGNRLGGIFFGGSTNNTHTIQNRASIETFTTQTWNLTNQGTNIVFSTTPNNTSSRVTALTLGQDQSATFTGSTDSTSATTGALIVAGGVGITKNLYLGKNTTMIFQATDPTADSGGVTVYSKNSNLSNTGIYYVNSTTSGELVSKRKALAYSIVFG
jgi:hypothetical protein